MSDSSRSGSGKKSETSWLQWLFAAFSGCLIVAVIGFFLYEGLTGTSSPPRITIQVDTIVATEGGYLVQFTANNAGESTAADLVVEGDVTTEGGEPERSQVTISYLPAGSSRSAGLFFQSDPARHGLEIRPVGFDTP